MQYQPLSDYLLISDIDGTLVNTKKEIPPRNIEAIAHFREMGRAASPLPQGVRPSRRPASPGRWGSTVRW